MGGRFCSLDQTHLALRKYFSENYVIPLPKLNEHQKKSSSPKIEVFFVKIRWRQKKRSSPEIEVVFREN